MLSANILKKNLFILARGRSVYRSNINAKFKMNDVAQSIVKKQLGNYALS